jgi:hypothetical protein
MWSVPAMDELGALGLDPAEPPAEGRLDLALHRVCLVAGHPPPPLHLRVAEAQRRRHPSAAAPGGRRRPGRRLDDDVEAAVAVRHDLVAVGPVVLPDGRRRVVGAVRAVVVGGGHRETTPGQGPRGESETGRRGKSETPLSFLLSVFFFAARGRGGCCC